MTDRQSLVMATSIALVFAAFGCATNNPPPAATATPTTQSAPTNAAATPPANVTTTAPAGANRAADDEVATGSSLTKFQRSRLLGHYSTHDGASGFILDRTTATWKAKIDGTNQVMTLSMKPGPYDTKEYRSDDHSIWLRIDEHGTVVLFQGPSQHEGVSVIRDADANQL